MNQPECGAAMSIMDLLPGDIGFSTISGSTGRWVNLGQSILRDACRFTHAYLVLADGMLIEAMPSGARVVPLAGRLVPGFAYARLDLTDVQRAEVTPVAMRYEGVPYSFVDYAALAALHFGLSTLRLRAYVTNSGRMICSQLADQILTDIGYHLFDDGRLPQDVTPGDLYYAADPRVIAA